MIAYWYKTYIWHFGKGAKKKNEKTGKVVTTTGMRVWFFSIYSTVYLASPNKKIYYLWWGTDQEATCVWQGDSEGPFRRQEHGGPWRVAVGRVRSSYLSNRGSDWAPPPQLKIYTQHPPRSTEVASWPRTPKSSIRTFSNSNFSSPHGDNWFFFASR